MSSPISQVDLAALQSTAATMGTAIEGGRGEVTRMRGESEQLLATWLGPAANEFRNAAEQLHRNGDDLFNALERMRQLMTQTQGAFSDTNEQTTSGAGQIGADVAASAPTGLAGL